MDEKCQASGCENRGELSKEGLCDICQEDLNETRKERGESGNSSHK